MKNKSNPLAMIVVLIIIIVIIGWVYNLFKRGKDYRECQEEAAYIAVNHPSAVPKYSPNDQMAILNEWYKTCMQARGQNP